MDEVSSPAQSELARCAPSPWCAASRVAPGSPRSPSPAPASRRRRRSRSREDADKAWRLGALAEVADGGRGGGGLGCHLPGRCALGRRGNSADGARAGAGAEARAERGDDEGRPPSSAAPAPPPSSCLHPGGSSRWRGVGGGCGTRSPGSGTGSGLRDSRFGRIRKGVRDIWYPRLGVFADPPDASTQDAKQGLKPKIKKPVGQSSPQDWSAVQGGLAERLWGCAEIVPIPPGTAPGPERTLRRGFLSPSL